jgi:two-component system, OmpR family, sensor kinase
LIGRWARGRRLLGRSSLRWRLVIWVTAVVIITSAIVFGVVYEQTGSQLRTQIDHDVAGDVAALRQTAREVGHRSSGQLGAALSAYLRAQPFTGTSSLLFAVVPGYGTVSNHPELLGSAEPDNGESATEQAHENALARKLLTGPVGLSTRVVPDVGKVRFDERLVRVGAVTLRVGAGEPLNVVERAEHSIARSFVIAGVLALTLALLASYLAGASVSLPLRRMAKVAARVDDGDLDPRMNPPRAASSEIHVLSESFNHMLDRLSEAFAAQRDFIADASHELRTPLTVIAGQMEVLAAQPDPDAEEVRRVERLIAAEIARMSRLVDDMLLLARSEQASFLQLQEIELEPFVNELWAAACLGHQRRFELGAVPDARLTADPDRLAQALRNLIRNAIEHTSEPSGLVRLEVEPRPDSKVAFSVLDDGPGIDREHRERVFERFHRTDEARSREAGGAGLGLAIVMAIAQAHGGTARVLDTVTGGARVELELAGLHRLSSLSGSRAAGLRSSGRR